MCDKFSSKELKSLHFSYKFESKLLTHYNFQATKRNSVSDTFSTFVFETDFIDIFRYKNIY